MLSKALVITSINRPNKVLKKYSELSKKHNVKFYIIGDKKTPKNFKIKNSNYLSLSHQKKLIFSYSKICKKNTYVRKNIGYLEAMRNGADVILETDDDNMPKQNFFANIDPYINSIILKNKNWINIYEYFFGNKNSVLWPRGYPLDKIKTKSSTVLEFL